MQPLVFTRRRVLPGLLVLSALAGLAVMDGNRRRPANPHAVLDVRGEDRMRPRAGRVLRVATFNIRGGKGRDGVRDLDRIAATLEGVDLAVLQEVHGAPFGCGDQCGELGERMSCASLFCPAETRWWGDSFGNGLLARVPVAGFHRIPLAGTQDRRFRNALLAFVPFEGRTVRVLTVHLDDRADHDAQLAAMTRLFLSLEPPAVLLGDLNTPKGHPELRALVEAKGVTAVIGEEWSDRNPLRGVDWIIARGLCRVRSAPRDKGGSDHPAITAELALLDDGTGAHAPRDPGRMSNPLTETISADSAPSRR